MTRYWPLGDGRKLTSPYGPRGGSFHFGVDFGRDGGSANMPVFSPADGIVRYAGAAQGYGGPDPAGWVVIESSTETWELGHIVRLPHITVGTHVKAGQKVATVNPNSATNGGTAPHLHVSYMPGGYNPGNKKDPMPALAGAKEPEAMSMQTGWHGDPIWLADVLRAYRPAIKLEGLPSWNKYGHGDFGNLWGVMVHHTGNARETAQSIRDGRPDLQGPLANIHIAQDGTVTLVAVGVCWHAGRGEYPGIPTNQANFHLIGIEAAWPRDTSLTPATAHRERWPDAQIIAMRDTVAAILKKLGFAADRVISHAEWAGRSQGKWDPGNLNMDWFRAEVAKSMRGDFAKPEQPEPKPEPVPPPADPTQAILEQLVGPAGKGWPQLGGRTIVDAIATLRDNW